MAFAVLAAACAASLDAPVMDGAPPRELESELEPATGDTRERALRQCLFVSNHTGFTVAVLVDGRHAGWVGPSSSAAFFVGRSAGAQAELRAICEAGEWRESVRGPAWEYTWHLRPGTRGRR